MGMVDTGMIIGIPIELSIEVEPQPPHWID
jgi:hypothetical protein